MCVRLARILLESATGMIRGPLGLLVLLAPVGLAPIVIAGLLLFGGGKAPSQLPFNFLDGFYPPAIEVKAKLKAIQEKKEAAAAAEAAAKKAAEKAAAEEAAKAEAAKAKAAPAPAAAKK